MSAARVELIAIASASTIAESIRIQMLLDRASLPYRMQGDKLFGLYGDAAIALAGPIRFLIPSELKEQAEHCLQEIFDVRPFAQAGLCPACEARVPKGEVDCPACGLFLG